MFNPFALSSLVPKMFAQQAGNVHKLLPKIVEFETFEDITKCNSGFEKLKKVGIPLFTLAPFNMISMLVHTDWLADLFGVRGVKKVYDNTPMYLFKFPFFPFPKLPVPDLFNKKLSEINPLNQIFTSGNMNFIPTTESMKVIEVDQAHATGIKGKGVKLAVLDTGVNNLNPMFGRVIEEAVFPSIGDSQGHGSWCCGCAFGNKAYDPFTQLTVEGMAPESNKISVKVFPELLPMTSTDIIIKGIEAAMNRGAKVISMSLGGEDCGDVDCAYKPVLDNMYERGIIPVIAAGNAGPGSQTIGCPGCHEKAITVGAVSITGPAADFSSRGPTKAGLKKPDCMAPGGASQFDEYIHSACSGTSDGYPDGAPLSGFESMMGTSMSTPHVAGLFALWVERARQKGIELNLEMVKQIIATNGEAKNNISGYGTIKYNWIEEFLKS